MILEEDREKFKKLGVNTLLEFALIIPKTYDNSFINQTPELNQQNCIEVEVLRVSKTIKLLSIDFFCKTWNEKLKGVIFKPNFYHSKLFKSGEKLHVKGRVVWNLGKIQIVQPQALKEINKIIPKYKMPLQNATMKNLVDKYITKESLMKSGLSEKDSENLLHVHNPSIGFVRDFEKNGLSEEIIDTLKFTEIYSYLNSLSGKSIKYEAKSRLDSSELDFIKKLPFKLTNDQLKCISEIKDDFLGKYAAKRLIMGDVGSGKTMVMLSAFMMAYPKRVVLMAPTTVLVNQIYDEAIKFLPKKIRVIKVVQNLAKSYDLGDYDFIIGTQALLFRDLPPTDLIMVDEQHRFGTNQRAKISNFVKDGKKRAHFLQFSATPIPRTLSMMHASLVDFSYIKELPFKKEIDTHIIRKKEFSKLVSHIKSEIKEGHQAIIVYPLVEESEVIDYQSIDEGRGYWEKNFENVYVTFGKDKLKEEILEDFRNKGDILVATTIVEVGISLPRLTTIIIVAPERLGLASLHQLRGRVSRNGLKGYCFLYTNLQKSERLDKFIKTTDGFEIAELDLSYRAGGDTLKGVFQSGKRFIWFDMSKDEDILKKAKASLGQTVAD